MTRAGRSNAILAATAVVLVAVLWVMGSVLSLQLDADRPPAAGSTVRVLSAPSLRGQFDSVELNSDRLRAVPVYTTEGLSVRLLKR